MEKLRNSWQLVKASWAVLQSDRELLLFPVFSGLAMIAVTIVLLLPVAVLTGILALITGGSGEPSFDIVSTLLLFFYYLVSYTVVIYFNTALVGAALIRLDGGDPTVRDGLKIANERLGIIVQYAAISATVGVVLQMLRERGGILGEIVAWLGGAAWNIATFLVIPILAAKNIGPIDAIKESTALVKRTWGEQLAGNFGLGAVFGIGFVVVILVGGLLIALLASISGTLALLGVLLLVLAIVALIVMSSAMGGIYQSILYRFAEAGTAPNDVDIEIIRGAFVPKDKRG